MNGRKRVLKELDLNELYKKTNNTNMKKKDSKVSLNLENFNNKDMKVVLICFKLT